MTDESILAKIHKLLALATSDNENEAAVAASKAQSLLIQHNISEDELENFNSVKSEKVVQVRTAGKNARNRSAWYGTLAHIVAKANLCNLLIDGSGLIWIGKKTNIEVAEYIFDNLARDLTRISDMVFKQYQRENPYNSTHGKTWKNNFYHGANQSIRERLNANLRQLKEADKINALVVRSDIELEEYMKVHYPRLTYVRTSYSSSRSGFEAGKAAGRAIGFRSGIGAGGSSGPKLLNKG